MLLAGDNVCDDDGVRTAGDKLAVLFLFDKNKIEIQRYHI